MMRLLTRAGVFALLSAVVFGQSEPAKQFDVADVHVRPHNSNATPSTTGGVLRNGRYDLRNASMLQLIAVAYDMNSGDRIVGGPSWLDRNRFDIIAKAPASATQDSVKTMLQALLADRFKLTVHRDTKSIPGYALTAPAGKAKLKEASGGSGTCDSLPNQPGAGGTVLAVVACHGITMDAFAGEVQNMAGGYTNGGFVADQTGLKGTFDVELRWTPRALIAQAGADAVTFFKAVEQLGLKLDAQNVPTSVLVVDAVNEKPTDNPSGVAQNIPAPPPAEFDVADIKLSPPDTATSGRLQPGGRIDIQGMTMKQMIQIAWNLNGNEELLAGGPKWMDETKYSLVARSTTAIAGSGTNMQIDIDDLRLMLQGLLKQRFKLVTHFEDRPVTAYTLVADKPKMAKADPVNRTNCKEGPLPGAKDPRDTSPMLSRLVSCQNMTMSQLAEDLTRLAGGYIKVPVVDASGIEGAYDFSINFTPVGRLNGGGRGDGGGAGGAGGLAPVAADPSGGLSLFDALSKQLGVKLEMKKRPIPVLVVDSVQEKPSDN
jgi:uncharacterized protein (TIGR03435 family)